MAFFFSRYLPSTPMFKSSKCPQNISMTSNSQKKDEICMVGDLFNIGKIIKNLTGHFKVTVRH